MPRQPERVHFKVLKDGSPIRRLSFDEQPSWETLITTLRKLYEIPPHLDLSLSYIDSDHDKITANSNEELRALYDYCDSKAGYRVILSTIPAVCQNAGVVSSSTNEEYSDEEGSVDAEGTQSNNTTRSTSCTDTTPPLSPISGDSGHGHPMSPPPGYAPANPHLQHPFGFPQHAYGPNQGMFVNPGSTSPTMYYSGPGGLYAVPMAMSPPMSTWKDGNATVAVSPFPGHQWALPVGVSPSQGLAMEKSVHGNDLLVFSGGAVYPPSHHFSAVSYSVDSGAMHVD